MLEKAILESEPLKDNPDLNTPKDRDSKFEKNKHY